MNEYGALTTNPVYGTGYKYASVIPAQAGIQKHMTYYVYILASHRNGTLYTGVTNNLLRRVFQHQEGFGSKFTAKYGVDRLVFYEGTPDVEQAILREKQIKKWNRVWKLRLIEEMNPEWKDLSEGF